MPDWPEHGVAEAAAEIAQLRVEVDRLVTEGIADRESLIVAQESLADLQLAIEDQGWSPFGRSDSMAELDADARKKAATWARVSMIANPLLRRAMNLRTAYIWGSGPTVQVPDSELDGGGDAQDVNAIVQGFLDDPANRATLVGAVANSENEEALGCEGELFFSLPTNPITGRVVVRKIEPDEITEIVTNPDDREDPWFYRRQFVETRLNITTGKVDNTTRTIWYPALGYNPRTSDKRVNVIGGDRVEWSQPIRHVRVNRPTSRAKHGMGDLHPALPWVKATKEVLEAWVLLFKAVARYSYQITAPRDRVQQAAARVRASQAAAPPAGNPPNAGGTYVGGTDNRLEAVNKTGAVIDADGAKPIMTMIAAGVGLPITMLLGDPGTTGARAVAETLDEPTQLVFRTRRGVWTEVYQDIVGHVIDWAVKTRQLSGSIAYDYDRELITLAGDQDRTVQVEWDEYDTTPTVDRVSAIMDAAEHLPPAVLLRLLLAALQVPDADQVFDAATDDEGNVIISAQQDAALDRAARQATGDQQDQQDNQPGGDPAQ